MKLDILEARPLNDYALTVRMVKIGEVEGKDELQCLQKAKAMGHIAPILGTASPVVLSPPRDERREDRRLSR